MSLEGFVCPECMESFKNSEELLSHFNERHKHQFANHENGSAKEDFDSEKMRSESYMNLISELTTHNSTLLDRISADQNRIIELEALIESLLRQTPLPDSIVIKDQELQDELDRYFEYQVQLASSRSRVDECETLLTAKTNEISVLQTRIKEMQLAVPTCNSGVNVDMDKANSGSLFSSKEHLTQNITEFATSQLMPVDSKFLFEKSDIGTMTEEETGFESNSTLFRESLLQELQATNHLLTNEVKELKNELESTSQKLAQSVNELEVTKNVVRQLSEENKIQQTEIVKQKTVQSILDTQNQELKLTITRINEQLESIQKNQQSLINQLNQCKYENEQTKTNLETELFKLRSELNQAVSERDAIQFKFEKLETEFNPSQAALLESNEKVIQLEKEIEKLRTDSRSELASYQKETNSLMEKLIHAEDIASNLKNELNIKSLKLIETQTAMFELGRENVNLQVQQGKCINRQWAKDDEAPNCSSCRKEFSISNRRHHCRNCGGIFCQSCSSQKATTTFSKDPVRVCQSCYEDLTGDLTT